MCERLAAAGLTDGSSLECITTRDEAPPRYIIWYTIQGAVHRQLLLLAFNWCWKSHTHTHTHARTHTNTHTHRKQLRTCRKHLETDTRKQTMHTYTEMYTGNAHTHTQTHVHTHICTHTYTHTEKPQIHSTH